MAAAKRKPSASAASTKSFDDDVPSERDALKTWNDMDDAALEVEIAKYRDAVARLKAEIVAKDGDRAIDGVDWFEYERDATTTVDGADGGAAGGENDDEDEELGNIDDIDPREWMVPKQCIPVHANVTTYDWKPMYEHEQFDVIMMDPPWQLATANPTRGVSLGYSQLTDQHIADLPLPQLQKNGLLFVWVINAKYQRI